MAERVKLENAALESIAESLRTFEPALSAGCANLEQEIDALANAIAFLNALSDVTSAVAKIVSFAA